MLFEDNNETAENDAIQAQILRIYDKSFRCEIVWIPGQMSQPHSLLTLESSLASILPLELRGRLFGSCGRFLGCCCRTSTKPRTSSCYYVAYALALTSLLHPYFRVYVCTAVILAPDGSGEYRKAEGCSRYSRGQGEPFGRLSKLSYPSWGPRNTIGALL